jgi:hypothetical protein
MSIETHEQTARIQEKRLAISARRTFQLEPPKIDNQGAGKIHSEKS